MQEMKRKFTGGASLTQTHPAVSANLLAGHIAAFNKLLCDMPSVDVSRDRTALSGKFPEDELKAGRELDLRNMLNFRRIRIGG